MKWWPACSYVHAIQLLAAEMIHASEAHEHAGVYQHICASKEVVAEPNNVSGEVFDEAIKGYR